LDLKNSSTLGKRLAANSTLVLTDILFPITLGDMALDLQQLDPDRWQRRLRLLAELADAKAVRARVSPRRLRADRLRELIATRRRLAG
jgi:hypothetical protein